MVPMPQHGSCTPPVNCSRAISVETHHSGSTYQSCSSRAYSLFRSPIVDPQLGQDVVYHHDLVGEQVLAALDRVDAVDDGGVVAVHDLADLHARELLAGVQLPDRVVPGSRHEVGFLLAQQHAQLDVVGHAHRREDRPVLESAVAGLLDDGAVLLQEVPAFFFLLPDQDLLLLVPVARLASGIAGVGLKVHRPCLADEWHHPLRIQCPPDDFFRCHLCPSPTNVPRAYAILLPKTEGWRPPSRVTAFLVSPCGSATAAGAAAERTRCGPTGHAAQRFGSRSA